MRWADIEVPNLPAAMDARGRSACYPRGTFYRLIDGPPTRNRRVTKPCFHICSSSHSHSEAPFWPYPPRAIANRTEGALGPLRYFLGGHRPSETAHLTRSLDRIHGARLECQHRKSGISLVTPSELASGVHRLPPMLHIPHQHPMPGYSKGPRGLSVPSRERGILTATTISPSLLLRQRPSRYAFRARRNLPDKELRYLRTLIVRAAVYQSFSSGLRPPQGPNPSP